MSVESCSSTVCGRRACRSSRGPCGDAGNNPCRRQGDQVVAPGSTGAGCWLRTTMAPRRAPISRQPDCAAGGVGRPVLLSQGAHARMGVPVGKGPPGHAQDDPETFGSGRRLAPAFARGCGRRQAPGRRARASSGAGLSAPPRRRLLHGGATVWARRSGTWIPSRRRAPRLEAVNDRARERVQYERNPGERWGGPGDRVSQLVRGHVRRDDDPSAAG
jgi:hypothetical protein